MMKMSYLTFDNNPPTVLSLDAMDLSGEQHTNIMHNIFKRRLDFDGKPIEDPKKTG